MIISNSPDDRRSTDTLRGVLEQVLQIHAHSFPDAREVKWNSGTLYRTFVLRGDTYHYSISGSPSFQSITCELNPHIERNLERVRWYHELEILKCKNYLQGETDSSSHSGHQNFDAAYLAEYFMRDQISPFFKTQSGDALLFIRIEDIKGSNSLRLSKILVSERRPESHLFYELKIETDFTGFTPAFRRIWWRESKGIPYRDFQSIPFQKCDSVNNATRVLSPYFELMLKPAKQIFAP